jgi:hypothetical protein
MADELNRNIEALWSDYEFLTKEISRFIDTKSDDMVQDLVNQRNRLEEIIKEKDDKVYHKTPEGKALIGAILAINKEATNRLQHRYNNLQQQHRISLAYDGDSGLMQQMHYLDEDM